MQVNLDISGQPEHRSVPELNAAIRLGTLERSADEIAVYDEVVARFGAAAEPALREQVARALVNKPQRDTVGHLHRQFSRPASRSRTPLLRASLADCAMNA